MLFTFSDLSDFKSSRHKIVANSNVFAIIKIRNVLTQLKLKLVKKCDKFGTYQWLL